MRKYTNRIFHPDDETRYSKMDIHILSILTRIVFRVPEEISIDKYKHWHFQTLPPWHPVENGYVKLLWPLELMPDGRLTLASAFKGPLAGSFSYPLDEFDDFERRFPRRDSKMP
jgi:hypothetical protein